jgi:indolepyruvate ferredoxin oxidoreductase
MRLIGEHLQALEYSLAHGRLEAARAYSHANQLNRIVQRGPDDRIGVIAAGKTYYDLRQALSDLAVSEDELSRSGVRILQVRMPFPLDGEVVREFARGLKEILVIEEKQPFLERLVKDELYNLAERPIVVGKHDEEGRPLVKPDGELGSDSIAQVIGTRIPALGELQTVRDRLARLRTLPVPAAINAVRAPYYCSGCPHNTSTTQLPEGALVGAGIGCHGMVTLMRPEEVGELTGITQMGGEGAQWIGMAPFTDRQHIFQNIGDGTYNHSGSLAIRASAGAGTNITYKLLWNSHIAMTGGQDPMPGLALPNVVRELLAEGAKRVIITSEEPSRWARADLPPGVEVWHRERIVEAQKTLAAIPGMTVLVHDQECAAELRRRRKRGKADDPPMRVVINERVCEGCGDCGEKSNCLSVHPVETEFGRKTQIHQASCNKDYSCLKGDCPSFLTVIPADGPRRTPARAARLDSGDVAAPADPAILGDEFGVRITGVGGTGIVTVAQTLGTAALLDGRHVRGLDQTGLAQKGGPVVSDLKLTASPLAGANKAATADCDLYIAADLLVGASRPYLAAADPERTIAVISTARVPTGRMVVDTSARFPDPDGLVQRILGRSVSERGVQLDAQALAERLFGTDVVANMLLVGAAYQAGALPLSVGSIESAIKLNGVAVEANLQAFRRGRQAVADPAALRRALDAIHSPVPAPAPSPTTRKVAAGVRAESGSELERSVALRVAELIDYQDSAYAASYARTVERVRAVESERVPGTSELVEAVAFFLHKLMAYKDEYEVARLHLDPRLRRELEDQFGPDAKISWRLHPPALRSLGMQRKIELGEWFGSGFRALAAMRRLRGTRLDPFGYTRVRRVERELIGEYRALIDHIVERLNADNHAVAVELARLPDLIRGYEEIKLRGVERYRARVVELRPQLDLVPVRTVAAGARR